MREKRTRVRRRSLLAAVGTGALAALAGCGGTATETGTRTGTPTPTGTPIPTGTPTESPTPTASPTPEAGSLRERARRFVRLLDGGEFRRAAELFGGAAADQVTPAALSDLWTSLNTRLGAFQGLGDTERKAASRGTAILVTLRFASGERVFRLVFAPGDSPASRSIVGLLLLEPYTRPDYVDRAGFTSEALELDAGDCSLPARLTVPAGTESVPGVVVVPGSGATDRNGTVGTNEPYRDVAEGLSSRGVAVLRYDKRTLHCSPSAGELTVDSVVVDDALSGVERLRAHDGVDESSVVVVGHSFGGALTPRVASRDGEVAGTVGLAANARPLYELIVAQTAYTTEYDGRVTEPERRQREQVRNAVQRIRDGDLDPGEFVLGGSKAFWESLQAYDRFATARSLSVPQAFLQGTADWQVTDEDDLALWRSELPGDGVSFRTFDGLDHLFTPGRGRPQERFVSQNVEKAVVDAVRGHVELATGK